MVWPVLHPAPQDTALRAISTWRTLFWLTLGALFSAGVVLPWLAPNLMPAAVQWRQKEAAPLPSPIPPSPVVGTNYPAGTRIRDCADDTLCPWLRVLPTGRFLMGSAASEKGHDEDEGPQRWVTIGTSIAVMETEVTRAQFALFVADTKRALKEGCFGWTGSEWDFDKSKNWQSPGFAQTAAHPAVCIDWDDAIAFATWWSAQTGEKYRLLTEAEWEYAARAGSTTRFNFGDRDADLCQYGNVADQNAKAVFKDFVIADCSDGQVYTAPVRSYKPNAFGLHDMHGNAWEWVADCWHENYRGAPLDGRNWQINCSGDGRRVLRGGGWSINPDFTRSANRAGNAPGGRDYDSGFRLARTLSSSTLTPLPTAEQVKK